MYPCRNITTHTHPYPSLLVHTVDLPCGTPANYSRWSDELSPTCCPLRTLLSRCRALLSTDLRRRPLPIIFSLRRYFLVPLPILMSKHQGHIQNVSTLSQHLPTPVLTSDQLSKTLKISSLKADRSLYDLLFPNSPEENVQKQQHSMIFSNRRKTIVFAYTPFSWG